MLYKQVELSHPNAELRLLEVFYHKIYKVWDCFWRLLSVDVNLVAGCHERLGFEIPLFWFIRLFFFLILCGMYGHCSLWTPTSSKSEVFIISVTRLVTEMGYLRLVAPWVYFCLKYS